MFITVAVSEGTECLFNPDCMVNVLLAAVKKRSDIPKKGTGFSKVRKELKFLKYVLNW